MATFINLLLHIQSLTNSDPTRYEYTTFECFGAFENRETFIKMIILYYISYMKQMLS